MLTVWRLEKQRYASEAFRGRGALQSGGRWHQKGAQVAYASEHPGVAALEKLVWLESYQRATRSDYVLLSLQLDPERHLERTDLQALPDGWDGFPHLEVTKRLGMRWLTEERSVALEVPSAVIPVAKNYLINPFHSGFAELKHGEAQPFSWDSRLFKRQCEKKEDSNG